MAKNLEVLDWRVHTLEESCFSSSKFSRPSEKSNLIYIIKEKQTERECLHECPSKVLAYLYGADFFPAASYLWLYDPKNSKLWLV